MRISQPRYSVGNTRRFIVTNLVDDHGLRFLY